MIPAQALIDGFRRTIRYVGHISEGITHADSLIQPAFKANCLNWTLGHIVEYRMVVSHLLDLPGPAEPGLLDRYLRESEPIRSDGPGVVPYERLLGLLEQSQAPIEERLAGLAPAEWAAPTSVGDRVTSLAERLTFLYFHETFHVGHADVLVALING